MRNKKRLIDVTETMKVRTNVKSGAAVRPIYILSPIRPPVYYIYAPIDVE